MQIALGLPSGISDACGCGLRCGLRISDADCGLRIAMRIAGCGARGPGAGHGRLPPTPPLRARAPLPPAP
jgi:hypothetical protein